MVMVHLLRKVMMREKQLNWVIRWVSSCVIMA